MSRSLASSILRIDGCRNLRVQAGCYYHFVTSACACSSEPADWITSLHSLCMYIQRGNPDGTPRALQVTEHICTHTYMSVRVHPHITAQKPLAERSPSPEPAVSFEGKERHRLGRRGLLCQNRKSTLLSLSLSLSLCLLSHS